MNNINPNPSIKKFGGTFISSNIPWGEHLIAKLISLVHHKIRAVAVLVSPIAHLTVNPNIAALASGNDLLRMRSATNPGARSVQYRKL